MKIKAGRFAAILLTAFFVMSAAGCGAGTGIEPGRFFDAARNIIDGRGDSSVSAENSALSENRTFSDVSETGNPDMSDIADPAESSGYLYGTLNADLQSVYDDMYAKIMTHSQDISVSAPNQDDLGTVLQAVMSDHPEIFWMDGAATFTSNSLSDIYKIHFDFNIDADEIDGIRNQIDAAADEYLAQIPEGTGEYDRARLAYEYIVNNTEYVAGSAQNQNIQSVFLYHESVCAGYSKAYKYLLDKAGVWCACISGQIASSGVNHAWNLIRIGGTYTYVDPSWGDPTYGENAEDSERLDIIYDYFCLTSAEMQRSGHVPAQRYPTVSADSNEYDYYRLNGYMYDDIDYDSMEQLFQNAVDGGSNVVYMKFTSFDAYARAVALMESGEDGPIHEPLQEKMRREGSSSMQYYTSKSDELWIIKVYW